MVAAKLLILIFILRMYYRKGIYIIMFQICIYMYRRELDDLGQQYNDRMRKVYMDTFLQWNSSFYLTMSYIQSFLFSSGGSLLGQSEAK